MSERQTKRKQFNEKPGNSRRMLVPVLVLALVIAAAAGWFFLGGSSTGRHALVKAGQDGRIHFTSADFADGKARYYRWQGSAGPIDFFIVRSGDGVIRAAFDACDVCFPEHKGYRQEGNDMVCNNCGQHFRTDLVNVVKGGCNPAPLHRQMDGNEVVIAINDIAQGAGYFSTATN